MNLRQDLRQCDEKEKNGRLGFGLVGCGRIGKVYREAILSDTAYELKGIAD